MIITNNVTDVVDKEVRLYFYVNRMGGGVIPPQAVVNAVKVTLSLHMHYHHCRLEKWTTP